MKVMPASSAAWMVAIERAAVRAALDGHGHAAEPDRADDDVADLRCLHSWFSLVWEGKVRWPVGSPGVVLRRGLVAREDLVEPGQRLVVERDVERAHGRVELLLGARADDRRR